MHSLRRVQYFVEICGLIMKICGFAICKLDLKIAGFRWQNEPASLRISDFFRTFTKSCLAHLSFLLIVKSDYVLLSSFCRQFVIYRVPLGEEREGTIKIFSLVFKKVLK
jgi:hypothetical protein